MGRAALFVGLVLILSLGLAGTASAAAQTTGSPDSSSTTTSTTGETSTVLQGTADQSPAGVSTLPAPAVAGQPVGATQSGGVLDQATSWMTDAATWITARIQGLISKTTTPELSADWYRSRFAAMAALGLGLSALVAMIALGSAALRRDPSALSATLVGMFRAGLGTGLVLALTAMALGVADGIANVVAANGSGETAAKFWSDVAQAWGGANYAGFGSSAIAFLFATVQVLAGLAVWVELLARDAGIYVAVLFMPAALAASIWPRLRAWQSRLATLLFVLIALKPVVIVVLSLSGYAASSGGNVAQDSGVLVGAVVILVLAAFTPWALIALMTSGGEAHVTANDALATRGQATGTSGRVGGGLGHAGPARLAITRGGARAGDRLHRAQMDGGAGRPSGTHRVGGGSAGGWMSRPALSGAVAAAAGLATAPPGADTDAAENDPRPPRDDGSART
jgi:hypothetical protein